jgi:hypothetical protein
LLLGARLPGCQTYLCHDETNKRFYIRLISGATKGTTQLTSFGVGGAYMTSFVPLTTGTMALGESTTPLGWKSLALANVAAPSSPGTGDLWNDSTGTNFQGFAAGIKRFLHGTPFTSTATGTIANSVTETSITGTGVGTKTLPAAFFVVGRTLRVTLWGIYSTANPAVTLQIKAKLGSTVILDTGAQTPTAAMANRGFCVTGLITCRTTGATGTVFGQGSANMSISATDSQAWDMENTATATIDTTASQAFDVTATWGAGVGASDTISGTNFLLEIVQ